MEIKFAADPAVVAIVEQHTALAARTKHLEIVNAGGLIQAAEELKTIRTAMREVDDAEERIKRPLMQALEEVRSQAKSARAPFLEIKSRIDGAILKFNQEQERQRQIEQRRQDEAAAAERKRLQEIADRARAKAQEEAQERRREAERVEAEDAEKAVALRASAARIEDKGHSKAAQFEERATTTVAPIVQTEQTRVVGVSQRDNWKCRVKDKTKLPEPFKIADETKIGKLVKSLKLEALPLLGGADAVEIYNEPILASARA